MNFVRTCFPCCLMVDRSILMADKDVPFFSLDGYETHAKVVHVYDGDTVHVVFQMPHIYKIAKWRARLSGIDTPELRVAEQKQDALKAKEKLVDILKQTDNIVYIKCGTFDKYGRLLIYMLPHKNSTTINQMMIDSGHAYIYDGGTKAVYKKLIL